MKLADRSTNISHGVVMIENLMTVPFDENPYSAMAAYFKTDEGLEVYRSIEKKLS